MTKKALIVGFVAMLSLSTFAQTASTKIKDARTKPDLYFLQDGQQASSLDLLPAPPQEAFSSYMTRLNTNGERCNVTRQEEIKQLQMHVLVVTECLMLSLMHSVLR